MLGEAVPVEYPPCGAIDKETFNNMGLNPADFEFTPKAKQEDVMEKLGLEVFGPQGVPILPTHSTDPALAKTLARNDKGKCDYSGSRNEQGQRHGFGTCTWRDGSRYEGDWVNDVRQGYGSFMQPDGVGYQGQWYDDQKHGRGVEYRDEEGRKKIVGTWQHNILNGLFMYYPNKKSDGTLLIAKEGLWIRT